MLYPDGSVNDAVQRGTALAAVMTGDYECAITGKGFDALLERPDPELVQPVLRRGAVFARMSPDNKRDLMHLLGNGLDTAPAAQPLGLHVGGSRGWGLLIAVFPFQGCFLVPRPCQLLCFHVSDRPKPKNRPNKTQASAATAPTTAAPSRPPTWASHCVRPRPRWRRP